MQNFTGQTILVQQCGARLPLPSIVIPSATPAVNRLANFIDAGRTAAFAILVGAACGLIPMKSFAQSTAAAPQREVYKQADGRSLNLEIFPAEGRRGSGPVACAVLFHGGGFQRGKTSSVYPMAQALAGAGMMAMSVEYRLINRAAGPSPEPVLDAKSAMRYVRANAARLGCVPDRIAAGGRSAGGTLALLTALKPEFDDPKDDRSISAEPNALVLFNPGVNLVDGHESEGPEAFRRKVSPIHLLDKTRIPPTLLMHGTADKVSPYEEVVAFKNKAIAQGNTDVTLKSFEGRGHGFFRQNKRGGEDFDASIGAMVDFFKRLGWVP